MMEKSYMPLNNMQFELILPKKIIFGNGSVERVGDEAKNLGCENALVVTSEGMKKREALKKVIDSLNSEGINSKIFYEVEPEPPIENVYECMEFAEGADLIIGMGGGSVIDVAKKSAADLSLRKVMIPTTAGTGSEVTHEAVLKVEGKKRAFVNKKLTPDVAIIDPELMMSMPPRLAAATGLDAITHALECYESKRSNPLVKTLSLEAFKLLRENIRKALEGDREAKINMCLGSLMAGMAFGNSGTTLAHALSYSLSNRGVPHGEAVAMVLPYALEFNAADPDLIREIREITKLVEFKWDTSWNIEEMAQEVMSDERHLANNPRNVTYRDVLQIFERIRDSLTEQ